MISKNEAKYIQSLSQKKQRDISGHFVAEGVKLVEELIQSPIGVHLIYATEDWVAPVSISLPIKRVSEPELARISSLQTPNKALLIGVIPSYTITSIPEQSFSLVLDDIQDPGNLGTLIRIADWFGIQQIFASNNTVDCFNPKVVQATMGSIARVEVIYTNLVEALAKTNVPSYGALLGGKSMYDYAGVKEGLLVIGNESKGISNEVAKLLQYTISIPRKGAAESLNAAVAAGILIAHLYR
jgi:RNA methyltransferase, TrmH family